MVNFRPVPRNWVLAGHPRRGQCMGRHGPIWKRRRGRREQRRIIAPPPSSRVRRFTPRAAKVGWGDEEISMDLFRQILIFKTLLFYYLNHVGSDKSVSILFCAEQFFFVDISTVRRAQNVRKTCRVSPSKEPILTPQPRPLSLLFLRHLLILSSFSSSSVWSFSHMPSPSPSPFSPMSLGSE